MNRIPFHLVEPSPWPIASALSAFALTLGLVNWFHGGCVSLIPLALTLLSITLYQWWRDVVREATFMGKHTTHVQSGLRVGMVLFIISEICFFFAFFWAFFHSSLTPVHEIGCMWPPVGVNPLDPFGVPLLNTTVLLASGFTVTWTHYSLVNGHRNKSLLSMIMTISLGSYFTMLQLMEYLESPFSTADGIYGSVFFVATGFHGLHVMIGTSFLLINLYRIGARHFSSAHHFGFEAAAWYWHFVDVVWICLFACLYWWGS